MILEKATETSHHKMVLRRLTVFYVMVIFLGMNIERRTC